MSSEIERALFELRGFVERNRARYPISDPFPSRALEIIERSDVRVPPEGSAILLDILELTGKYDDAVDLHGRTTYEGDDLRRDACVVRALGRCTLDAGVVPVLTAMLQAVTFDRHYAAPGGTPDVDKFDRDEAVECAQDALARACAELLGQLPLDAAAQAALQAATRHRCDDTRSAARRALARAR